MSLFFIHLSQSITGMIKMRKHIVAQVHIWFLALQAASERWEAGSTGPTAAWYALTSGSLSVSSCATNHDHCRRLLGSFALFWHGLCLKTSLSSKVYVLEVS